MQRFVSTPITDPFSAVAETGRMSMRAAMVPEEKFFAETRNKTARAKSPNQARPWNGGGLLRFTPQGDRWGGSCCGTSANRLQVEGRAPGNSDVFEGVGVAFSGLSETRTSSFNAERTPSGDVSPQLRKFFSLLEFQPSKAVKATMQKNIIALTITLSENGMEFR